MTDTAFGVQEVAHFHWVGRAVARLFDELNTGVESGGEEIDWPSVQVTFEKAPHLTDYIKIRVKGQYVV